MAAGRSGQSVEVTRAVILILVMVGVYLLVVNWGAAAAQLGHLVRTLGG